MRHIISIIVENKPGVLTRISGLFSRRGFNIESLSVGVTENPKHSRMTIIVEGDQDVLEQIQKQLYKLVDTLKVIDLPPETSVGRELIMVKVNADKSVRSEVIQITDIYRGRIVDVGENVLTVELTGEDGKLNAFINMMSKFGIKELVRTGKVALHRGSKTVI